MASGVLRDISNLKIARLAQQQSQYEAAKTALLADAKSHDDPLTVLIEGLKKLGLDGDATDASLLNLYLFKEQAKRDTSIPRALTQEWESELLRALDAKSRRYEFTGLFAKLATEWADNPNDGNVSLRSSTGNSETSAHSTADAEEFEPVGREEMHKQRQEWDSNVFTERKTDSAAITQYLLDLFSNTTKAKRLSKTPLEQLRRSMRAFFVDEHGRPESMRCSEENVRSCVKSVLKADLFTGEKRNALLDLVDARSAVLREIADVLSTESSSLGLWQWQPSPVPVYMRRQLNGKYRVYMDPEIHQALLVHWVGARFCVHLKRSFTAFFKSGAWTSSQLASMRAHDKVRRKFYVDQFMPSRGTKCVKTSRRVHFEEDFFMSQLASNTTEGNREYGGDADSTSDDTVVGKSPLEVKQSLLHIATTEMLLQKKLYGKFTLVQTDFKWFGPSLPHSTIFAVLRFFELPDYWIQFFEKFLSVPLVFPNDGPEAEVRTRKCGVPISHALSDGLGEAVLFCLDFAVNRATRGRVQMYRFHDDIWFWGQEADCVVAWKTVLSFTEVMGMSINHEKTGSMNLKDTAQEAVPSADLPQGQVRWGFLIFDSSGGQWTIDMESIDEHIVELRRQLVACRSVFSEIQVWNRYFSRFFSNSFGPATNCLGRAHLDMVLSTFEKMQDKLFASFGSSSSRDITSHLKGTIELRFGVEKIPDSFLSFPNEHGGLGVRNPFVTLLAVYDKALEKPSEILDEAFEDEVEEYEAAKERFDKGDKYEHPSEIPEGCDTKEFMSFEEYVRFREETSKPLLDAYEKLLAMPAVRGVEQTNAVRAAMKSLPPELYRCKSINSDWSSMDVYWQWVLQLYAKEAMSNFGGLVLGERDMLPVELVKLLSNEKLRLQG